MHLFDSKLVLVAAAATFVLAVSACGGGDGADEGAGGPATDGTTEAAPPPPTPAELNAQARIDGEWNVTYVLKKSTIKGYPKRERRVYTFSHTCAEGPCGGALTIVNPKTKQRFEDDPMTYSNGSYTITEKAANDCVDPESGEVRVKGGFRYTTTFNLKVTKAQAEGSESVGTAFAGTRVQVIKVTPKAKAMNCLVGRVESTIKGVRAGS